MFQYTDKVVQLSALSAPGTLSPHIKGPRFISSCRHPLPQPGVHSSTIALWILLVLTRHKWNHTTGGLLSLGSPQKVCACRGVFQAHSIAYLYRALYLFMSLCVVTLTAVNICAQVSLWVSLGSEKCWEFLKSCQTVPESGFPPAEYEGCSLSRPLQCLLWFYKLSKPSWSVWSLMLGFAFP